MALKGAGPVAEDRRDLDHSKPSVPDPRTLPNRIIHVTEQHACQMLSGRQTLTSSKSGQLEELAKKRRQTRRDGYGHIGDYHGGRYDCNFVSPYTKSAPNVDSPIFIMLQDWASDDFLRGTFCEDSERF